MTALCLMSVVASSLPRLARDHEVMYNSGGARARASSAGENLGLLNELRAAFGIAAAA
jgi:hypothetical protein